jgi:tRNA(adenine34) deaminase
MPMDPSQFEEWMDLALGQAAAAEAAGDVPIGAVIVRSDPGAADAGRVIAAAHNRRIIDADPTAHAEMLAIRAAAGALGDWRLAGCTIVVTLEPCCMCAGAIVLARLDRLVYGAPDAKAGAVDTLYRICADERLNHRVEAVAGVRAAQCGAMLTKFFRKQRAMGKK